MVQRCVKTWADSAKLPVLWEGDQGIKLSVNDFWSCWARPVNFDLRLGGPFQGTLTSAIGVGITW